MSLACSFRVQGVIIAISVYWKCGLLEMDFAKGVPAPFSQHFGSSRTSLGNMRPNVVKLVSLMPWNECYPVCGIDSRSHGRRIVRRRSCLSFVLSSSALSRIIYKVGVKVNVEVFLAVLYHRILLFTTTSVVLFPS